MNIGSKVRLLHGREEGIITKIGSGKYVEVDLGDGFSIPVLTSEIVLVSPMEARLAPPAPTTQDDSHKLFNPRSTAFVTQGIYLAFVPINDREIVLHLLNTTDWRIAFSIFGRNGEKLQGMACHLLEKNQSHQITRLLYKDFEEWPVFETTLLRYSDKMTPDDLVLRHSLRCRIQRFQKLFQKAPLLETNAHLFQIDAEGSQAVDQKAPPLRGNLIRDKMLEPKETTRNASYPARLSRQIDLHAEALSESTQGMSASEILAVQLAAFKAYLDGAIAQGLEEVTIIHGAGQGKLRDEIHRTLSKHPNVAYYKDAQKEKFGYGATVAHLK